MRTQIYIAVLLIVVGSTAVATWSFRTDIAEVTLTIDKPLQLHKVDLSGNASIVNRTFEIRGSNQLYAVENSKLSMMHVSGLSKEEKKQFAELSLKVKIAEGTNTVDLLEEEQWTVGATFDKGESAMVELTLAGELADDVDRDSIGFDVLAVFVGREG